jgi:uncharacterized protein
MAAVSIDGVAGTPHSNWLRQRPVLLFVVVTFLVSYGLGVPTLFIVGSWASGLNDVAELYLGRFFVVMGPACGAIAAVCATSGRTAISSFLRRRLSLAPRWWLAAILIPLAGLALVVAAYAGAGLPLRTIGAGLRDTWPLLLVHFAFQILVIGLGEELGWRGWLLPKLTATHGLSRATLFTGIVWYFWHFPILLGGIDDAFWFAMAVTGLSIIFSVIWFRSGRSAVAPAIAHGSVNAPVVFFTTVLPDADHQVAWKYLCGILATCGLIALLWTRAQWRRTSET